MSQGEPGIPGTKGERGPPGPTTFNLEKQETQYIRPVSIFSNCVNEMILN